MVKVEKEALESLLRVSLSGRLENTVKPSVTTQSNFYLKL